MAIKSKRINPDIHFRLLNALEDEPHLTQRALAKKLGISLGGVNYCLKALVEVGQIKMSNFENNPNKLNYFYLLTPKGMKEKFLLTSEFLKRKMVQYNQLKQEIESIQSKIKL